MLPRYCIYNFLGLLDPFGFFIVVITFFYLLRMHINFSIPDGFRGSWAPYAHQGDQATNHRQGPYSIKVYVILFYFIQHKDKEDVWRMFSKLQYDSPVTAYLWL